ncbi:hypothetical protein RJ640_006296 [Escallonia rubra]|uniref:Reverse transcriptase Ty1/copia-type domain-containing protein n=1 Tax=Escallonia rubra TaxID=112253 RepID=A0AA88S5K2_9ASTE|nr:hypothetical protein RJ640_006296 [Escallonia rubra]
MIITGDNESEISNLRNDLSVRFDMKILGEIGCFLGLEIEKSDQGYFGSQRAYAKSLLERFSMGDSKEKATPMEPNLKLKKDKGKPLKDARKFRQLVGSLIYLTITRPEISYSVSVVSQFMQNPRTPHLEAARRILRYVKGTLDYGLLYKRCDNFVLSGFTDADWAGDTNDRHSTSGYCFNTGSATVSWCSKKQNIVVLSSTEAEYVAATMATQECVWLKRLIEDMFCEVDYAVQIKLGHVQRGCIYQPLNVQDQKFCPYGPWLRAEHEGKCPKNAEWNPPLNGEISAPAILLHDRRLLPQIPVGDTPKVRSQYNAPSPANPTSPHLTSQHQPTDKPHNPT